MRTKESMDWRPIYNNCLASLDQWVFVKIDPTRNELAYAKRKGLEAEIITALTLSDKRILRVRLSTRNVDRFFSLNPRVKVDFDRDSVNEAVSSESSASDDNHSPELQSLLRELLS